MTDQNAPLILVVDDYQDAREMYAEYLQFSGFRVAEARNGNEAVDQAFALKPDLILMDLSLPGMDGWEATRRLKADEVPGTFPSSPSPATPWRAPRMAPRRPDAIRSLQNRVCPTTSWWRFAGC